MPDRAGFINIHLGGGTAQGLLMLLLALTQFGTLSEKDLESALSNPKTLSRRPRLRGRETEFQFKMLAFCCNILLSNR